MPADANRRSVDAPETPQMIDARAVDAEAVLMSLASRQHGVVTRTQLLQAGVSGDVVDRRVRARRLRAVHRGVYLVGPVHAAHAREMAAVLACNNGAVLNHWNAGILWQCCRREDVAGPVDVSATRGDHFRRPGIRFHLLRTLRADEVTQLGGIPLTTVGRTVYDLASVADQRALERIVAEAFDLGITNRAELLSLLPRWSGRRGAIRLRALLDRDEDLAATRSRAEEDFLALIQKGELPAPAVNTTIGGHRVDFYWRAERFVVEIDGVAFHSSRRKFESDRRRDAELAAAGLRVVRVTWRQLVREREALLVRLTQALTLARIG
jgi:very-short-patch-repair endonuclease